MAKNEVAKQADTGIAVFSAEKPDWIKAGNAGSEDVTIKDMVLPRIDVIQALSPQIKKSDPAFIPGANQGDIFNTVTGQIYGSSVTFVPVMFRREFIVWKLRTAGSGFAGAFKTLEEAEKAQCALPDPNNYEVSESHQHFAMVINGEKADSVVFSMAKSRLKTSRSLNTLVQMAEVDRFAKAYVATAIEVSGPKGDYWSMKITPAGFVPEALYNKGKELYEMIKSGAADVDRAAPNSSEEHSSGNGEL